MNDKVLLAVLRERTSASGTRYLSGWLGKARIVGFLDRDAAEGETQWQIYAQTPDDQRGPQGNGSGGEQRRTNGGNGGGAQHAYGRQQRPASRGPRQPVPQGELNDPMPF